MRIQYASDLHLEMSANDSWLVKNPLEVAGDILLLAGDTGLFGDWTYNPNHPFWKWVSTKYSLVIAIPGNHEFYRLWDLDSMTDGWTLDLYPNVHCVYNAVIKLGENVDMIATTLWSKIKPEDAPETEWYVNDFHRIRSGMRYLGWKRFNEEHERCLKFLKKSVAESKAEHLIVMSHHVPSFALSDPEFEGSASNGAFNVELGDFISDSRIEYWIYGHSHRNIDKVIGNTKCVSNQLGYVRHGEHLTFNPAKTIEL